MNCQRAREIVAGAVATPARQHDVARAHLATCPVCQMRLASLAAATLSPEAEALSCAECQASLARWRALAGRDSDPAAALPTVARHLATCAECADGLAATTAALSALRAGALPAPPSPPNIRTDFLRPTVSPLAPPFAARVATRLGLAGRPAWRRAASGAAALLLLAVGAWLVGSGGREQRVTVVGPVAPLTPAGTAASAAPFPRPTRAATAVQPGLPPPAGPSPAEPTDPPPTASPRRDPPTGEPPTAPAIALAAPALVDGQSGLVRFSWVAPPLGADRVFDLRVCQGADCFPVLGKTHTTALDWVWCPDGGAGRYRWQVAVIGAADGRVVGPVSPIADLDWPGGECAEPPGNPTPPPEPTSSDPPLEP